MKNEHNYNFEFWDHKLFGVLAMINALADHYMPPVELELAKENLEATNYEENLWTDISINGKNHQLELLLAKNTHEDKSSVVIMITSQEDLTAEIKTLSIFQSLFKTLDVEQH